MSDEERISLDEVCTTLQLAPHVVRSLLTEYRPWLTTAESEGGLSREDFARLTRIHAWRSQGLSAAEIRRRLEAGQESGEGEAGLNLLLEEIGRMAGLLQASEEKRAEDRDRLMLALMRTQQEIQQLRYEVAASKSRRERRKGFWSRLFG